MSVFTPPLSPQSESACFLIPSYFDITNRFLHTYSLNCCFPLQSPCHYSWVTVSQYCTRSIPPLGGPAILVRFEKPPPAQACVVRVSCLSSVPLCGECQTRTESVDMPLCYVMYPTEKHLDSYFVESAIPLLPCQSPCNEWL